jgi:hypothetical protein
VKKPAPFAPAHPPPDPPETRFQETEDVNGEDSRLAALKRRQALETVKRSQSSAGEQTDGQESSKEKTGAQQQNSEK